MIGSARCGERLTQASREPVASCCVRRRRLLFQLAEIRSTVYDQLDEAIELDEFQARLSQDSLFDSDVNLFTSRTV